MRSLKSEFKHGRFRFRVKLASLGLKLLHSLWSKPIKFKGITIYPSNHVFIPNKMTFSSLFLAENLKIEEGCEVLDVGCGSGILTILAALKAKRVVAVDINPKALECTVKNAQLNGVKDRVEVRLGNLFSPLKNGEKFDLIVFNPPYLPGKPRNLVEAGWMDSGALTLKFLSESPKWLKRNGKIQLAYSSIGALKPEEIFKAAEKANLKTSSIINHRRMLETYTVYTFKFK
jgi:release factor glutamine methyltransferase